MSLSVHLGCDAPSTPITVDFSKIKNSCLLPETLKVKEELTKIFSELELSYQTLSQYDEELHQAFLDRNIESIHPQISSVYPFGNYLIKRVQAIQVGAAFAGYWSQSSGVKIAGSTAHRYNHVLRPFNVRRLEKIIYDHNFKVSLPKEYLFEIGDESIPEPFRYLVISEKRALFDAEAGRKVISSWSLERQKKFFGHLCEFVYVTGVIDAHLANFCLDLRRVVTIEGEQFPEIVLVDAEPFGLITEEHDTPPVSDLGEFGKKRRLGLRDARYVGLLRLLLNVEQLGLGVEIRTLVNQWVEKAKGEMAPTCASKTVRGVFCALCNIVYCGVFYCYHWVKGCFNKETREEEVALV